eukprot:CAMPEP_0113894244 /NCGR_PEP_ID=MMETSP0780_2-20120614/16590_1 /TAXON_ID=652834 /ORGANISM="Palpitomonas bilix" /LENGTH=437 /DNA_ID=CAMNT_0000884723 /DNA_START=251 /DNA_END=1561 /DNA_ORIENTATION=- /assembly_acc=CAM_ASM_000599
MSAAGCTAVQVDWTEVFKEQRKKFTAVRKEYASSILPLKVFCDEIASGGKGIAREFRRLNLSSKGSHHDGTTCAFCGVVDIPPVEQEKKKGWLSSVLSALKPFSSEKSSSPMKSLRKFGALQPSHFIKSANERESLSPVVICDTCSLFIIAEEKRQNYLRGMHNRHMTKGEEVYYAFADVRMQFDASSSNPLEMNECIKKAVSLLSCGLRGDVRGEKGMAFALRRWIEEKLPIAKMALRASKLKCSQEEDDRKEARQKQQDIETGTDMSSMRNKVQPAARMRLHHVLIPSQDAVFSGVFDVDGIPLQWPWLNSARPSRLRPGGKRVRCTLTESLLILHLPLVKDKNIAVYLESDTMASLELDEGRKSSLRLYKEPGRVIGIAFRILNVALGWLEDGGETKDDARGKGLALVVGQYVLRLFGHEGRELLHFLQGIQIS